MRHVAVVLLVALTGCSKASTFELLLIHDQALVPARDFTTGELIVVDVGDLATDADDEIAFQWSGRASELLEGVTRPDLRALVAGHLHIAAVAFEATAGCASTSRVVGRSQVFTHDDTGGRIPVSIGCAGEIMSTRGAPGRGRLGHGIAATLDGQAIIAGGAQTFDPTAAPRVFQGAVPEVEAYDMLSGRFTDVGLLSEGRALAGTVRLASDEVAVIGGRAVASGDCLSSGEIASPAPRADLASLASPRCWPAATTLDSAEVIVFGGKEASEEPTLERFDPDLTRRVDAGGALSGPPRMGPQLLAAGDLAIAIGGGGFGAPRVEALIPDCDGAGAACSAEIPIDRADDPGPGWVGMTGALIPCREGNVDTALALYVGGGGVIPGEGAEPSATLGDIFCALFPAEARDPPPVVTLRAVGTLPAPRREHRTLPVTNGGRGWDLLFIGGLNDEPGDFETVVRVEAQPCTCGVGNASAVPARGAPTLLLHDAVPLLDGTVLVVGGGRLNFVDGTFNGSPWAGIYFPPLSVP